MAFLLIFTLSALFCHTLLAMSSANYYINWDSINIGGSDFSSSTNYYMSDSIGQTVSGLTTSTNFDLYGGYRIPDFGGFYLEFNVKAQLDASKIAYTVFDNNNLQVTLNDSSGYAVGDHIVVVENLGPNELIAIGKIENISVNTLTVDKWEGDNAVMSASPSGNDDWVYKMQGNELELGTLTTSGVKTGVSILEVYTGASNGYSVTMAEDGNLRYGPFSISDVADGTVTAGSEEYGVETVGPTAVGSGDINIDSAGKTVQESNTAANFDRVGIIYKASVDTATEGGAYEHTVSYYVTANF